MSRFLYIFSYQTPQQAAVPNQACPDESCHALFIEAESADKALAWGRQISDEFVKRLFSGEGPRWSEQDFAHWVEAEPEREYPAEVLQQLKAVGYGEFPQF